MPSLVHLYNYTLLSVSFTYNFWMIGWCFWRGSWYVFKRGGYCWDEDQGVNICLHEVSGVLQCQVLVSVNLIHYQILTYKINYSSYSRKHKRRKTASAVKVPRYRWYYSRSNQLLFALHFATVTTEEKDEELRAKLQSKSEDGLQVLLLWHRWKCMQGSEVS